MTLSINFSNKAIIIFSVLLLSGCTSATQPSISLMIPDKPAAAVGGLTVTVLPVTNLSSVKAPVKKIRNSFEKRLYKEGFNIIDRKSIESFMARNRVRYLAGIDKKISIALDRETNAEAVIITTLDHYDELYPPKVAITSRLVSTGNKPEILWIDSVGLTGDDSPAILGLGLIKDPHVLLNNAVKKLLDSLTIYLSEKKLMGHSLKKENNKFQPKLHRRFSAAIDSDSEYTFAVIPFFNRSERKYAGEIMALHFIREMTKAENFNIMEPGLVRDALLKFRVIMIEGISLENASALFSRLNVDFILTGTVIDYHDYQGPRGAPKVDFSVMVLDRKSRKAVWISKSYNEGDESVFFFDFGKINSANAMASEMVRAVVQKMRQ